MKRTLKNETILSLRMQLAECQRCAHANMCPHQSPGCTCSDFLCADFLQPAAEYSRTRSVKLILVSLCSFLQFLSLPAVAKDFSLPVIHQLTCCGSDEISVEGTNGQCLDLPGCDTVTSCMLGTLCLPKCYYERVNPVTGCVKKVKDSHFKAKKVGGKWECGCEMPYQLNEQAKKCCEPVTPNKELCQRSVTGEDGCPVLKGCPDDQSCSNGQCVNPLNPPPPPSKPPYKKDPLPPPPPYKPPLIDDDGPTVEINYKTTKKTYYGLDECCVQKQSKIVSYTPTNEKDIRWFDDVSKCNVSSDKKEECDCKKEEKDSSTHKKWNDADKKCECDTGYSRAEDGSCCQLQTKTFYLYDECCNEKGDPKPVTDCTPKTPETSTLGYRYLEKGECKVKTENKTECDCKKEEKDSSTHKKWNDTDKKCECDTGYSRTDDGSCCQLQTKTFYLYDSCCNVQGSPETVVDCDPEPKDPRYRETCEESEKDITICTCGEGYELKKAGICECKNLQNKVYSKYSDGCCVPESYSYCPKGDDVDADDPHKDDSCVFDSNKKWTGGACVCEDGYYNENGECKYCDPNNCSAMDGNVCKSICSEDQKCDGNGSCTCPSGQKLDASVGCTCEGWSEYTYKQEMEYGCVSDVTVMACSKPADHEGNATQCACADKANAHWNGTECVCNEGYYKEGDECKYCDLKCNTIDNNQCKPISCSMGQVCAPEIGCTCPSGQKLDASVGCTCAGWGEYTYKQEMEYGCVSDVTVMACSKPTDHEGNATQCACADKANAHWNGTECVCNEGYYKEGDECKYCDLKCNTIDNNQCKPISCSMGQVCAAEIGCTCPSGQKLDASVGCTCAGWSEYTYNVVDSNGCTTETTVKACNPPDNEAGNPEQCACADKTGMTWNNGKCICVGEDYYLLGDECKYCDPAGCNVLVNDVCVNYSTMGTYQVKEGHCCTTVEKEYCPWYEQGAPDNSPGCKAETGWVWNDAGSCVSIVTPVEPEKCSVGKEWDSSEGKCVCDGDNNYYPIGSSGECSRCASCQQPAYDNMTSKYVCQDACPYYDQVCDVQQGECVYPASSGTGYSNDTEYSNGTAYSNASCASASC